MPEAWWTPERVERAKDMRVLGMSGHQIARALGTTKNAVIGKLYRLGISRPPRPPKQAPLGSSAVSFPHSAPKQSKSSPAESSANPTAATRPVGTNQETGSPETVCALNAPRAKVLTQPPRTPSVVARAGGTNSETGSSAHGRLRVTPPLAEAARPPLVETSTGGTIPIPRGRSGTAREAPSTLEGRRATAVGVQPASRPIPSVTILSRRMDQCAFIAGHPAGPATVVCGAKVANEFGSYCPEHRARVYQPYRPLRRKA